MIYESFWGEFIGMKHGEHGPHGESHFPYIICHLLFVIGDDDVRVILGRIHWDELPGTQGLFWILDLMKPCFLGKPFFHFSLDCFNSIRIDDHQFMHWQHSFYFTLYSRQKAMKIAFSHIPYSQMHNPRRRR